MKTVLSIFTCIFAIGIGFLYTTTTLNDSSYEYMISRVASIPRQLKTKIFNLPRTSTNTTFTRTMTADAQPTADSAFHGLPSIPPNETFTTNAPRKIQKSFLAIEQSEGAGAKVRRSIGTPQLRNLSPFLMLDHFSIPASAGFPDHNHRGQETLTYLLSGAVDHEDFTGHAGTIHAGDLQFMTAGRGIMHAEMPSLSTPDGEPNVGMQLWVDLPLDLKNCEPRYRDLRASEIPHVTTKDGKVHVKIISGRAYDVDSVQELAYTPVWLLDFTVKPGGNVKQSLPRGWNAFAYTLSGTTVFSSDGISRPVNQYHNVVFEKEGDSIEASVEEGAEQESRFILVAGLPLDQPVVQYGPFVVTSREEVIQAIRDTQNFENGFERAKDWQSEIGKRMH